MHAWEKELSDAVPEGGDNFTLSDEDIEMRHIIQRATGREITAGRFVIESFNLSLEYDALFRV